MSNQAKLVQILAFNQRVAVIALYLSEKNKRFPYLAKKMINSVNQEDSV